MASHTACSRCGEWFELSPTGAGFARKVVALCPKCKAESGEVGRTSPEDASTIEGGLPSETGESLDESALTFPPMMVPPSRVAEVEAAAHRLHDERVIEYINSVLEKYDNEWQTVPQNLANAQAYVQSERETEGTNTLLRDAEYYLKARAMIAAGQSKVSRIAFTIGGIGLTLIYNGLKYVGVDMRANPDNPNSPPGGLEWVERGATDGYSDSFDARGAAPPAKLEGSGSN